MSVMGIFRDGAPGLTEYAKLCIKSKIKYTALSGEAATLHNGSCNMCNRKSILNFYLQRYALAARALHATSVSNKKGYSILGSKLIKYMSYMGQN